MNISLSFTYPWLLLALAVMIPCVLIPYFRLAKKYRRTRNRIVTIVISLLIMTLATLLASGFSVKYVVPNEKNEIILLVDVSDTENQSAERRDELVKTIIDDAKFDSFKVGIVTFGFNYNYAVKLTNKLNNVYDQYIDSLNEENVDTSATDIASALEYTKTLFSSDSSSKIVLITDGKQTDNDALGVIRSVVADGTKIDVANVNSSYGDEEVQVKNIVFPTNHINVNEDFLITVNVYSSVNTKANISLYDNDVLSSSVLTDYNLIVGDNEITLPYAFTANDLHNVTVTVEPQIDGLEQNNSLTAYYYLEVFNKVLIIENFGGDSTMLDAVLKEGDAYETTVTSVEEASSLFKTVNDLREFDQVIICFIVFICNLRLFIYSFL